LLQGVGELRECKQQRTAGNELQERSTFVHQNLRERGR
jgi:hypothetical protein